MRHPWLIVCLSSLPLPAQSWIRHGGPVCDIGFPMVVGDPARHRLTTVDHVGDTWEWNGSAWRLMARGAPGGFLVHDLQRRHTLLLGALPFVQLRWRGHAWEAMSPGTAPVEGGPAVFDAARGVVVMIERAARTVMEWDGANWRQAGGAGGVPQLIDAHLVYDGARGEVLLLGRGTSFQTWAWNGTSWTLRASGGPTSSVYACADDPARGRVVLHGGLGAPGDTWEWDGTRWTAVQSNGPLQRRAGALVFDSDRGQVLAFGGIPGLERGRSDAWAWTGATWQLVAAASEPVGRRFAAMAHAAQRGRLVLFGGQVDNVPLADVWEWDGARWFDVTPPGPGPGPRVAAAMAYDSLQDRVLLFGGIQGTTFAGDLWAWDGVQWTLLANSGPPPRAYHAMAFDGLRNRLVLHSGNDVNGRLNDTWEWDGAQWHQVPVPGPPVLVGNYGTMTFDPLRSTVLLLRVDTNQTWSWDGNAWTWLGSGLALPVYCMAFDPHAAAPVAFALGLSGQLDRWQWNGTAWSPVAGGGPFLGRLDQSVLAATDFALGRLLVYTGTLLWDRTAHPAAATDFGAACGAAGISPFLSSSGLPVLGDPDHGVELLGPANQPAAVGLGLQQVAVSIAGCTWHVDQPVVLLLRTDASGNGRVPLPLPRLPALRGLQLWSQGVVLAPGAASGLVTTQALLLQLGD